MTRAVTVTFALATVALMLYTIGAPYEIGG